MVVEQNYLLEYWISSDKFSEAELDVSVKKILAKIISHVKVEICQKDKYLILSITSTEKYIDSCYEKLDFDRDWSLITKDELGDALRAQAYPLLADIEVKLRNFIKQSMVEIVGFDWWDSFSPEKLREKVEDIEKKAKKDQVNKHHQIEFTFFENLIEIVTAKCQKWSDEQFISVADFCDLLLTSASLEEIQQEIRTRTKTVSAWDDVFIKYFDDAGTWINLEGNIKEVIPVRNKVMHHRLLRLHEMRTLRQCHDEVDRVLKLAKSELSDTEIEDVKPSLKVITDQFSHHFYSDLLNSGMIDTRGVAALRETITSVMKDAAALSADMRGSDALRETITSVMKEATALSAMKINLDMSGIEALYKATASSMNNTNTISASLEAAALAAVNLKNLQKYVKDLKPPI
jgi:predicted component of type VI protein secretion system